MKELPHSVMVVFGIPPLSIGRDRCLKAAPPGAGHGPVGKRTWIATHSSSVLRVPGRLQVNHNAGYCTKECVSQVPAL